MDRKQFFSIAQEKANSSLKIVDIDLLNIVIDDSGVIEEEADIDATLVIL